MRSTWPLLFAAASLVACDPPCSSIDVGNVCGKRDVTTKIIDEKGWPVVQAKINGRPVRLLVDTGAGVVSVSADLLGVPQASWRTLDQLCIEALCIEQALAWAQDNAIVQAAPDDRQVHGVIGMSLLRHAVLELNGSRTLRLDFDRRACTGQPIPLTFDKSGRPFAPMRVDGVEMGAVLLDTGALYTVLSEETSQRFGALRTTAMPTTVCTVHSCSQSGFLGELREVCVGELCEPQVLTKFPVWDAVGNSFFARGRYAFDFAARQLVRCTD